MAVLDELFVRLGYDVDQEKIDDFNEGVERTARGMKKVALSAIGAASALVFFTKKMAGVQNQQTQIAKNLNIPVQLAQAWQDAAEDMGVDSAKAVSALNKVNTVIENLVVGKPPSAEFLRGLSEIGLTLKDIEGIDASAALLKINQGLSALEPTVKGGVASLLGLRDELNFIGDARLANKINENIRNIDLTNLDAFTNKWADFTQAVRTSSLIFANEIAPTIGKALSSISAAMDENAKFMGGFVSSLLKGEIDILEPALNRLVGLSDKLLANDSRFIGKILESEAGQNAIGLLNDTFGLDVPQLAPAFSGGATGTNSTNTIKNDIKIDIVANDPIQAGKEVQKALENNNRKSLSNLESSQIN